MANAPIPVHQQFTDEQKQQIIIWYRDENLTLDEIGNKLGYKRRTISKLIEHLNDIHGGLKKDHKTSQKSRRDPDIEQKIIELRNAGSTLEVISAAVGLSISSVERTCKKFNIVAVDNRIKLDDNEVKRLYESGIGMIKLSRKLNVSAEAIRKSLNRSDVTRRAPIIKHVFTKQLIDLPSFIDTKDWFENAYVDECYGMSSIAAFVGRSVGYVSNKLKTYKIESRTISDSMRIYDKDYVVEIFKSCNQNISLTARTIDCDKNVVRMAARDAGYPAIDPSVKFVGTGNPFYGKKHDEETRESCAKIGAENGIKFWNDNPDYIEIVKQRSIKYWSDPSVRLADSVRIATLRAQGKCNSKQSIVDSRFGFINCDSSYEENFVVECENDDNIKFIEREFEIIEYEFDNEKHNYVPDFRVWYADGDFKVVEIKSRYWHDNDVCAEAKKAAAIARLADKYEYRLIEKD